MVGRNLSHYKIEAELGRGGMGIVYRATDTKLDRTVAIKLLPSAALASEDDRARFFREAQAAAQLHHPNIATVFEIDEAILRDGEGNEINATDGPRPYIAMEFVGGETLQETIKKAPLKLADAVNIASQVAEALKAAHTKEIVHRDIKSANVMITDDGIAKVLDFGLAKTNNSTMLTRMGSTLGTVAYMSPEQARGQEVDGRSDLYSLGTMMYEMICGALPFAGEYEQAVVYGILNESPDPLTSKRTGVPMQLEWIVNKLLAKDADYRYQSAAGLLADLMSVDLSGSGQSRRSMPAMSGSSMPDTPAGSISSSTPRWVWPAVVGALLLGGFGMWVSGVVAGDGSGTEASSTTYHFEMPRTEYSYAPQFNRRWFVLAPDGSSMVYVTNGNLYVRRASNFSRPELLRTPTNSEVFSDLAFSPDGNSFVFENSGARRVLMRSRISSEPPVRLADLGRATRGIHWATDGHIYMGMGSTGVARVSENGGAIEYLLGGPGKESSISYQTPFWIEKSNTLLVAARPEGLSWSESDIMVVDTETGEESVLISGGTDPSYLDTGVLIYFRAGYLYARSYDGESASSLGPEVPVASEVAFNFNGTTGAAFYSMAKDGSLIKWRGKYEEFDGGNVVLAWSDGENLKEVRPDVGTYYVPRIHPDGRLIAVQDGWFGSSASILILDGVTGNEIHRIDNAQMPVWSREGRGLTYGSNNAMLRRNLDNFETIDTLLTGDNRIDPTDWSPDGRYLLFNVEDGGMNNTSIRYLDLETGEVHPYLSVSRDLDYARFSPDGKWVTYEWGSVGDSQAAVQRFPGGEDELLVSDGSGNKPVWSEDGKYVYYSTERGIRRAELDLNAVQIVSQESVFQGVLYQFQAFDVHPEDGRLLIVPSSNVSTGPGDEVLDVGVWDIYVNWVSGFPELRPGGSE